MVTILIRWLIFLHVLSAITFFLAHGASAAMAFRVRKETDFARIRALVNHDSYGRIISGHGTDRYYPALLNSHMG